MGEHILVVRAEELRCHVDFQGFLPMSAEQFHRLYEALNVFGMDRDKAEHDPAFKQLIAYTAVRSGDLHLAYIRGKSLGEARLHGERSIGIGGHINSLDSALLHDDDYLKGAAYREVDEEIQITDDNLQLAGLLNDDSNNVGRVHLGLVYVADLKKPEVKKRERGIAQISFETPEELRARRDEFETWSQLLIDNLELL